ncbi:hypothetical protein [Polaromonas sp. DSR2-3-2]|uniref:hypothetical protein n=1 Tax=unclassified Polaromonas TaxID=2638319 RepID=UPI003CF83544
MQPMKPMVPMKPMAGLDSSWWPKGLSSPSSSGSQNGVRYAFFPDQRRLAVEQDGNLKQYDTGEHRISGVSQAQGSQGGDLRFSSQSGDVDLAALKEVR